MAGITSAEARRRVRIAQFAGLGVGVMAVALWAMDLPGLSPSLPSKPDVRESAAPTTPAILQVVRIDAEAPKGIAERLDMAANRPVAPPTTNPENPQPAPPPAAAESPWEYLGSIEEPDRLLALVSIKGRQKIVSQGTELKVMTPAAEGRPASVEHAAVVEEITRQHIVLDESGTRRTVPLKSKSTSVAWVKNMPTPVQGMQGGTVATSALTPEARQRLIAQGIDPNQAQQARIAALNAARGRGAGQPEGQSQASITAAANVKMAEVEAAKAKARARAVPVPISDNPDADAAAGAPRDMPVDSDRSNSRVPN